MLINKISYKKSKKFSEKKDYEDIKVLLVII